MDFTTIFQEHYKKLYGHVYSMIKDHHLTEDILQETFIKAYENMKSVVDESKVRPWLITIAKRTAIDFIRKDKRHGYDFVEDLYTLKEAPSPSVENKVEWVLLKNEIECEISSLKKEQKEIIHLKINDGLKEKEIANHLKMNQGTVKVNLYRARQHLKSRFEQQLVIA
ncbi:RNA polymerase sigma factor [Bacillus pinisoli]|uniref:RNA polymerase sigma factor n=1 Tax=Bacillus pinisoli TaxID=2901866 RepID=UPI001FF5C53F|nr:RNA polymerase sigma factor [Bacillus pinisoli]